MKSAIPLLVPAETLTKAGGRGNLVASASNMLGPVLGAALMGVLPMGPIMLVDILGAAFAVTCLLFVKIPDVPRSEEKPNFRADFRQGIAAMRANGPLMAVLPCYLLSSLVYMPLSSLFPLFVSDYFHGTAWRNGVVEFVFAGGLMASSLVMGIRGGARKRFIMMSAALGLQGAAILLSGLLPEGGYWGVRRLQLRAGCGRHRLQHPLHGLHPRKHARRSSGKVLSPLMTAAAFEPSREAVCKLGDMPSRDKAVPREGPRSIANIRDAPSSCRQPQRPGLFATPRPQRADPYSTPP